MDLDQQDFQNLRRLLALKRHEQPPPGYFENFSRQVIIRIQNGTGAKSSNWTSWLRGLLEIFETRPGLAGAFGFALCAFFGTGLLYSDAPPANTVIANSAVFEVPYERTAFARTSETNALMEPEFQRTSLFDQMKHQSPPMNVQFVNWR